jgi:hypothetical protein
VVEWVLGGEGREGEEEGKWCEWSKQLHHGPTQGCRR